MGSSARDGRSARRHVKARAAVEPIPAGAEHGRRIDAIAQARRRNRSPVRRWLYEHGIVLVASAIFAVSWVGQAVSGFLHHNDELREHGDRVLGFLTYLGSAHFWNATAENWQSEFLQIAMFVVLTAMLRQRGSPESKPLDTVEAVDEDPRVASLAGDVPWPVRRGGLALRLYEHSLSITLALLFVLSFALHLVSGARDHAQQQAWHGEPPPATMEFATSAAFWFEVFQNWQSEFMVVAVFTWLTVYLRERGSAQSKPVAMAHREQE
jgi:hypothetical protein